MICPECEKLQPKSIRGDHREYHCPNCGLLFEIKGLNMVTPTQKRFPRTKACHEVDLQFLIDAEEDDALAYKLQLEERGPICETCLWWENDCVRGT